MVCLRQVMHCAFMGDLSFRREFMLMGCRSSGALRIEVLLVECGGQKLTLGSAPTSHTPPHHVATGSRSGEPQPRFLSQPIGSPGLS